MCKKMTNMKTAVLAALAATLLSTSALAEKNNGMRPIDSGAAARADTKAARAGAAADALIAAKQQAERELHEAREQLQQVHNKTASITDLQTATDAANATNLATVNLKLEVGFSKQWTAPAPYASVIPGDIEIVDAMAGVTNRDVVIVAKKEGYTNLLLLDGEGVQVANVMLQVGTPLPQKQIRVHNKKDNLIAYSSYQCNPICVRREDKMEGTDRPRPPSTVVTIGDYTSRSTNTNINK
jgi:Flp pilus assembly secretin CpaC